MSKSIYPMKALLSRSLALSCCLALFVTACGDGGGGGKTTVTKSQFLRQGNEICQSTYADLNELFETDFPVTRERIPAFFEKAAPVLEKGVGDLRELDAPGNDQDEVDGILRAGDKMVAEWKAGIEDPEKGAQIFSAEGGEAQVDFEKKASQYGLTKCSHEEAEEGEGGEKLDPSTFSAEKRAYVEKADAICKRADEQGDPIEDESFASFPPPLEVWASFIPRILAIDKPALEELRRLEPPAGDKAKVTALLDNRVSLFKTAEQAGQAAAAKDEPRTAELLGQVFEKFEESDGELRGYGFQVCGSEDLEEE